MRGLAGHRIFVGFISGFALKDVHLRVVFHHTLVHTVESQSLTVGTPERPFVDAKLVAVYAFAVDNLARAVGGEFDGLAFSIADKEIKIFPEGKCPRFATPTFFHFLDVLTRLPPHDLLLPEVYENALPQVLHQHERLVGVGERGIIEMPDFQRVGCCCPFIEFVVGDENGLLTVLFVDGVAFVYIKTHQLVAPPSVILVLGHHIMVVVASEVQVFERELFLSKHIR